MVEPRRHVDPGTGLGIGLPDDWNVLPIEGSSVQVLVGPGANGFAPTLVATVSSLPDAADTDDAIAEGVDLWLQSAPGAQLLEAEPIDDLVQGLIGRRWAGAYSLLGRPLLLQSAALHANGLLTRLDLTVALDQARATGDLLRRVLSDLDLPSSAPAHPVSGDDVQLAAWAAQRLREGP